MCSEGELGDARVAGLAEGGVARVSFGRDRRSSAVADNMTTVGASNARRSSRPALEALAESPDQPSADTTHASQGDRGPAAAPPRRHSAAAPSMRRGSLPGKVLSRLSLGLSDALQWLGLRGSLPAPPRTQRLADGCRPGSTSLGFMEPELEAPRDRKGVWSRERGRGR